MTVEEAMAILIREIDEDPFLRTEHREKVHEALKMGIKALEQMGALNKIKAEINTPNRGTCDYFIVDRIEKIINEYGKGKEV